MSKETDRAKRLRKSATTGEHSAWQVLRLFRQHGFPVRRQHPIDNIIVDFAIMKARLVIEIDGSIHQQELIRRADVKRDARLADLGWTVLRIPNDEAFHCDHLFHLIADKLVLET